MRSTHFLFGLGSILLLLAACLVLRRGATHEEPWKPSISPEVSAKAPPELRSESLPLRQRYRQRPDTDEDRIILQTTEAELPQPGPDDEIYTLDSLPDSPGTYWVRQTDGPVSRFSICGSDGEPP